MRLTTAWARLSEPLDTRSLTKNKIGSLPGAGVAVRAGVGLGPGCVAVPIGVGVGLGCIPVWVGVGDGRGALVICDVGAGEGGTPLPLLWSTSRYCPMPDDDAHSTADSTEVPSPHSLNVAISCQGSPEVTMERTFDVHLVRSRARRSASPFFQKPGLIA